MDRVLAARAALGGATPASSAALQAQAALRVPSTVVPNESNYFLNTLHPDFKEAKVGEPQNFALDVRFKI